jgi:DNA polymerase
MDRTLAEEARALIASARAALEELAEEGIDHFERLPSAPVQAPPQAERSEARSEPRASEAQRPDPQAARSPARSEAQPSVVEQPDLTGIAHPWGERPTLEQVRQELGDCTRCRLHEGRNRIVFGDGNPEASLMFVGEGPGAEEDRQGLPFVGRAGELLTRMIEKGLGLARRDVYICNIVKCRPPGNRDPRSDEVATCRPFLDGQIAAVAPRVIVALGKPAASLLLGREVPITRVRGSWHEYRGIPLMPTYHPAFLLRQYTVENRRLVWEDLKAALARSQE